MSLWFFLSFLVVLGIKFRASHMLGKSCTTELHSSPGYNIFIHPSIHHLVSCVFGVKAIYLFIIYSLIHLYYCSQPAALSFMIRGLSNAHIFLYEASCT
jgi:hypothetical protein